MKPLCQLTRNTMIWMIVTILMVILPFAGHIPSWIYALALLTIGWRLMVHRGRLDFPPGWLRLMLVAVCLPALFFSFKQGSTLGATVALLLVGFLIKLLELYQRRDALVVLFIAYILAASVFLFNQSIPMALYILLTLIVITATLNTVYRSEQESNFWHPIKRSALLYMQAIPLMLVMFLIFPRIPPLWSVDPDAGQAFSGLSDSMAPGDVSRLTRSAEIAFRVTFEGAVPVASQRYWRGVIYDQFDGRSWRRSEQAESQFFAKAALRQTQTERYRYQVIMEPTAQRWRYALDLPQQVPANLVRNRDFTLSAAEPLMQRSQYRITSALDYGSWLLSESESQRYLQLPASGNPRSRKLARDWLQATADDQFKFISRLLQHFTRRFSYTLEPPGLQGDSIDQFLFQTQRGFCGHYAGASVFLLRAAGIPARVVGGYQGGELNPLDGSMTIRQYEAHAWIEVWLKGQGWQRLDPTAMVAPERVEQPAQQLFGTESGFLADALLARASLGNRWLQQMRWQYDALNYGWHRWVLNFENEQLNLLERLLGGISVLKMLMLLMIPAVIVLLLLSYSLLSGRRSAVDPVERCIARLNCKLARLGLQRGCGETVTDHARRVAEVVPELAVEIHEVAACYEQIRYAGNASEQVKKQLYKAADRCYAQIPLR
ncbi:transglutaminase TgpA family protein [Amphritea sp. HPY]|uniref:transglutaminase TgpA family protein n=1 Tax=Amphritea sp. HPY TaxID=3421652 RepID=UPI003D7CBC06